MLTDKQRLIIEDSLWVVNTALKRQGLQKNEDLRQSAILYMCECLERFNPEASIKWTTFAYKNVYLFIKRTNRKQMLKRSFEVYDCIEQLPESVYESNYNEFSIKPKRSIQEVKRICNEEEKKIIELKLNGYNAREISKILNIKTLRVHHCMSLIKTKSREVFLEK